MINNRHSERKKPKCLRSIVFSAKDDTNKYSHHPAIKYFDGKYYASWSSGEIGEDEPKQCVMYSISCDLSTWSEPKCLFEPTDNGVFTNCGFWVDDDTLVAYGGYYEYTNNEMRVGENHSKTTLLCKKTKNGLDWSENIDLMLPIVSNHQPQLLKNNTMLICGNISVALSDKTDGINGWKLIPFPPYENKFSYDDSAAITYLKEERSDKIFLCEIGVYEYDKKIIALFRSDTDCLYSSISSNNGKSWSYPEKTEFTDYHSKFFCGTLNDGRNYVISNPDSEYCRLPLVVSLTKDGENFNEQYVIADEIILMRYPSKYKGGYYAYPSCEYANGKLVVICSINKEDVMVISIDENELRID